MSYSIKTTGILRSGLINGKTYRFGLQDENGDFITRQKGNEVYLDWFHLDPKPTEAEIAAVEISQAYIDWYAEHGGDSTLTLRRKSREVVDGANELSVAQRAEMGERNKRDNYLVNRIIELQQALDAIKASSGPADNIRAAIPASWMATSTRARADARADLKAEINTGDSDT